jgi:GTP-binding protein
VNKIDLVPAGERERAVKRFLGGFRWRGKSLIISALTGEGCRELVFAVMTYLEKHKPPTAEDAEDAGKYTTGARGQRKSRTARVAPI